MKSLSSAVILFFLFNLCGFAQVKYFNKQYDYNETLDGFGEVLQTPDSGYFCAGAATVFGVSRAIQALKTDKAGNVIWNKRYPVDDVETFGYSAILFNDTSYLIAGMYAEIDTTAGVFSNRDCYLVKLNSNGDTIWTKRFGLGIGTSSNPDFESSNKVIQTSDGGFALIGHSSNFSGGKWRMYLVKTDSEGNLQWQKNYGGADHDGGMDILQAPDGGYYLLGWTDNFGIGIRNWYLVRTDVSGNQLWYKTYGTNDYNVGVSIAPTTDGNYVLAGGMYLTSLNSDGALIKIDTDGNIIWEKKYGGIKEEGFEKIIVLSDGSIVAAGATKSYGMDGKDDGWIIKTDALGNLMWSRVYAKDNGFYDYFFDIKPTSDNGFILCGQTHDTMPTYQNGWLVKTDCFGCDSVLCYFPDSVCPDLSIDVVELPADKSGNNELLVYPNPFKYSTTISYSINSMENNPQLVIYDIYGKIVKQQILENNKGSITLQLESLAGGIYQCIIFSGNEIEAKEKLVVVK